MTWSFDDSDGTYGYRRVHAHLARLGQHADPETIRLLMREHPEVTYKLLLQMCARVRRAEAVSPS